MLDTKEKAFTLIELLVSIAIVTILMAIILFDYRTFNDKLALSAAGQEIAIATRQGQSYGVNVRETGVGLGDFSRAYGIYFTTGDTTNYYVFVDKNTVNKLYDVGSGCGSGSTECVEKIALRNGVYISSIRKVGSCAETNNATGLHITFLRPNPDAEIRFTNSSPVPPCINQTDAQIVLQSPKGNSLTISIENTGQVYTQ
jgi:prepilin-type N-terminal cleavage/methylation domain-containing protein